MAKLPTTIRKVAKKIRKILLNLNYFSQLIHKMSEGSGARSMLSTFPLKIRSLPPHPNSFLMRICSLLSMLTFSFPKCFRISLRFF